MQRILRIPRSDAPENDPSPFVLLNVVSNGPQPLDVHLLGTDNQNPYFVSVRQRQVNKLRAANYTGSSEEWIAILSMVLLLLPRDPDFARATEGVEVIASVKDEDHMSIVLRKNIGGITHRLGTIALPYKDDQLDNIDLFNWSGLAAQAAVASQEEATALKARIKQQQEAMDRLQGQLEDLIKAKKEHEDAMLEKFALLLNSKKAKIRDQQRLLAGMAKEVKPDEESERSTAPSRKAAPSRKSKRKAKVEPEPDLESEPGSEPVLEQGELDGPDSVSAHASTPDRGEDTTDEEGVTGTPEPMRVQLEEPPPRRELPFAKRDGPARSSTRPDSPKQPRQPTPEDEETDDDDEL